MTSMRQFAAAEAGPEGADSGEGGWLLTTHPVDGQQSLPGRGPGQHTSKPTTLFHRW